MGVSSTFTREIRVWRVMCMRLKGCEGLTRSHEPKPVTQLAKQTTHLASQPASQHNTARKHTAFNEADLGSQVFLEATFSERKHLRFCGKKARKRKPCLSSPWSCFSHTDTYLSIFLSYAACHLQCLQLISVNVIELNQRGILICPCWMDWKSHWFCFLQMTMLFIG